MDELAKRFAVESAVRAINQCDDVKTLREVAVAVTKAYFECKGLIGTLMLDALKRSASEPKL